MSIVIAIDGPSAGGKGTIARGLAKQLNFAHLETGLLYRWVGKEWLARRKSESDLETATEIAKELNGHLRGLHQATLLNDPALRTNEVAEAASQTSQHPPVRAELIELQREFAKNPYFSVQDALAKPKGAILDGRDIATIICPDADVKLFVTASPEIRAARRTKELQLLGEAATYEQVLEDVRVRDHRDQTREIAPLMPTAGSITIDTSNLSAQESIDAALGIIRRTMASAGLFRHSRSNI